MASIRQFEGMELLARELVEGFITGLHRSPYHGFSVEFAEHKLYNFGESTKNIDWKVYAKTDRLYTKQYEEETNLRCTIILDTSTSMYYPRPGHDKIRFSAYCAAALSHLMIRQRDAVGLVTFDNQIRTQTAQKSTRTHLSNVLTELETCLAPSAEMASSSNISETIHLIADKIHKRSLVIIFTDMLEHTNATERLLQSLQHLKHNKHEVLLFHVSDKRTELAFDFNDRPHRFVDLETGKSIVVQPSQIRNDYRSKMSGLFEEIRLMGAKLKIDIVPVDTADPFDGVLSAYLIKRKKMR